MIVFGTECPIKKDDLGGYNRIRFPVCSLTRFALDAFGGCFEFDCHGKGAYVPW